MVRQAVGLYEDRLDGVQMETNLDAALPATLLDAEQLRRVFVNLIDNALDSLADQEGEKRITITTVQDHQRGLLDCRSG